MIKKGPRELFRWHNRRLAPRKANYICLYPAPRRQFMYNIQRITYYCGLLLLTAFKLPFERSIQILSSEDLYLYWLICVPLTYPVLLPFLSFNSLNQLKLLLHNLIGGFYIFHFSNISNRLARCHMNLNSEHAPDGRMCTIRLWWLQSNHVWWHILVDS